eukprot:m.63518 g.63518  ORF g.63518 m.63518 type:complete len:116 (+) comp13469_c0_seq6:532-879(+)
MAMADAADERAQEEQQHLRAAVHYTVGQLLEHNEEEEGVTFSKLFAASLADLTYRQIGSWTADLEAFARHAKRSTVSPDDIKLLARRDEDLVRWLLGCVFVGSGLLPPLLLTAKV